MRNAEMSEAYEMYETYGICGTGKKSEMNEKELDFTELLGVPFVDGGRSAERGFDCWGLCIEVFRLLGEPLTDFQVSCNDVEGAFASFEVERLNWVRHHWPHAPAPSVVAIRFSSDLVNHVGVYIGNGKFLHTRQKTGVVIEQADSPAWRHRIEGFYTLKRPKMPNMLKTLKNAEGGMRG